MIAQNFQLPEPDGPTTAELSAIDSEWPLIAAELALVDAECRLAFSPDVLAVRAHRRAVARVQSVAREQSRATAAGALFPFSVA